MNGGRCSKKSRFLEIKNNGMSFSNSLSVNARTKLRLKNLIIQQMLSG